MKRLPVKIIAHRGDHRNAPENSIESLLRASELGCDGVEVDVRSSHDGRPVLIHNRWTGDDGRPVKEQTVAQLSDSLGYPVALLDEALRMAPLRFWNVELKEWGAWTAVRDCLTSCATDVEFLVSSFLHRDLITAARQWENRPPNIRFGALFAHGSSDDGDIDWSRWKSRGMDAVVFHFGHIVDADIFDARAAGLDVFAYDLGLDEDFLRARSNELEGLITDFPARFLSLRGSSGSLGATGS